MSPLSCTAGSILRRWLLLLHAVAHGLGGGDPAVDRGGLGRAAAQVALDGLPVLAANLLAVAGKEALLGLGGVLRRQVVAVLCWHILGRRRNGPALCRALSAASVALGQLLGELLHDGGLGLLAGHAADVGGVD